MAEMISSRVKDAVRMDTTDEALFAALQDPECKERIEKWFNSSMRSEQVMVRLQFFVLFLRGKLGSEGLGVPSSWVVKSFGFNLDTSWDYANFSAECK